MSLTWTLLIVIVVVVLGAWQFWNPSRIARGNGADEREPVTLEERLQHLEAAQERFRAQRRTILGRIARAYVFVLVSTSVALYVSFHDESKLRHDEHSTQVETRRAREVQRTGAPVAVCLREALEATEPLLERIPSVERPLGAYVRLQDHRYPGVECPDRE